MFNRYRNKPSRPDIIPIKTYTCEKTGHLVTKYPTAYGPMRASHKVLGGGTGGNGRAKLYRRPLARNAKKPKNST